MKGDKHCVTFFAKLSLYFMSVVAARQYKYDVVSCPSPQQLMKSRRDAAYSNCDSDFDCPGDDVCCSTGKAKVCSNTVSKYQVIRRKINYYIPYF